MAPTGSRFFDTVKRWSPTLGEMLGTALATFVRMLFGRPTSRREDVARPTPLPSDQRTTSQRPAIPCLYCHGQGVTRGGRPCPICRGTGYW
jgi:hypothetical protein